MKDLLLITTIFICSLLAWFFVNNAINEIESKPPLEESIGKFALNGVRIDLEYLRDLPAYESK